MTKKRKKRPARPRKRGGGAADSNRRAVELALASLAHDIRTPLTGILALAELLAASELGARERRWASGVKSAAEHLAQLTTIVCDAVRADAVGLKLQQDAFSPRQLAEDLAQSLVARAETSGLKGETVIADNLPSAAIGDPVRLRACVENLIDNAVKFTARGGVRLAVTASRAARGRARLSFDVADSGIGLTASEIRKLFRPFAQANEAVARRYGGTGLGLSLVKRLARAMGGDLSVSSKAGQGSTFHLHVLVQIHVTQAGKRHGQGVRAVAVPERRRVLCVEDNPYGRVLLNTILSNLGHRVEFAGSGEKAVESVKAGGFDLVLMDVALSGMSGLDATRRIRALPAPVGHIPVIGISGSSDREREAIQSGMNAYLSKPVGPAELASAIEKVFAR